MRISNPVNLIPEWRRAWRFWSVQLVALLAIAAELYAALPELREHLTPETFARVSGILAALAIIARIVKQKEPPQ